MLVLAVFSILYGSVLAFSQDEPRLVVAYSSIAQLGFIVLGIFSLDDKGAQGALMQMVNHGLVVAPLFFIIALLTARAGGSPSLAQMGGMALRAPVLAAFFLIVTLATLAMPGSPNFVGEILILFGAFEDKFVFGVVASARRGAGGGLHDPRVPEVDAQPQRRGRRGGRDGRARVRGDRAGDAGGRGARRVPAAGARPDRGRVRASRSRWRREPAPQELAARGATPEGGAVPPGGAQQISPEELQPSRRRRRVERAREIDYQGLSPLFATIGGTVAVLMAGPDPRPLRPARAGAASLAAAALLTAIGLTIANWEAGRLGADHRGRAGDRHARALHVDALLRRRPGHGAALAARRRDARGRARASTWRCCSARSRGMVIVAGAENLVTLFVGFELLSIPLYILCAAEVRKAPSLEAGLKYLVVGSVGSATLLYGLALLYGATGSTDYSAMADAIGDTVGLGDPLLLTGVALATVGLAFKASVAPFHQWTPDVYQGAPTPVTAFMAVATKAAAFAIALRFFDLALPSLQSEWAPALAVLATITILVGNAGAIAQSSLKRMLAWSGVAQAGYLLAGVVVGTTLGLQATAFYLAAYLFMNVAAFAVVIGRERVSEHGRLDRVAARPRPRLPGAGLDDDDRDALAGRASPPPSASSASSI